MAVHATPIQESGPMKNAPSQMTPPPHAKKEKRAGRKPKEQRSPSVIGSLTELANVISAKFNQKVTKKDTSDWSLGNRFPNSKEWVEDGRPVFPKPDSGDSRWKSPPLAVFEWYEKYIFNPRAKAAEENSDWIARKEKADAIKVENFNAEWEKEHSEKWMLVTEHNISTRNLCAFLWPRFSRLVEQDLVKSLTEYCQKAVPEHAALIVEHFGSVVREKIDEFQVEMEKKAGEEIKDDRPA